MLWNKVAVAEGIASPTTVRSVAEEVSSEGSFKRPFRSQSLEVDAEPEDGGDGGGGGSDGGGDAGSNAAADDVSDKRSEGSRWRRSGARGKTLLVLRRGRGRSGSRAFLEYLHGWFALIAAAPHVFDCESFIHDPTIAATSTTVRVDAALLPPLTENQREPLFSLAPLTPSVRPPPPHDYPSTGLVVSLSHRLLQHQMLSTWDGLILSLVPNVLITHVGIGCFVAHRVSILPPPPQRPPQ